MSLFEYISEKISLHTVGMAQKSACDDNELTLEGQQPTIDDLNFHIYIKMKSFFENVTFFSSKDCQHARQVYLCIVGLCPQIGFVFCMEKNNAGHDINVMLILRH